MSFSFIIIPVFIYGVQEAIIYYILYKILYSHIYKILAKDIKKDVGDYLKKIIFKINSYHPEIEILEVNADIDYILKIIPLKYFISNIVNLLKANTGKKLIDKFRFLDKVYWEFKGIWSIGYFVSTFGINE